MDKTHADRKELLQARTMAHGVALRIARSSGRLMEADEIRAVADHALVEAWQRFDPRRGERFSTYAFHWVRGATLKALSRTSCPVDVDVDVEGLSGEARVSIDVMVAGRRALRRVPYHDRGLVFEHVVMEQSLRRLARGRSLSALRGRYRRALGRAAKEG